MGGDIKNLLITDNVSHIILYIRRRIKPCYNQQTCCVVQAVHRFHPGFPVRMAIWGAVLKINPPMSHKDAIDEIGLY